MCIAIMDKTKLYACVILNNRQVHVFQLVSFLNINLEVWILFDKFGRFV